MLYLPRYMGKLLLSAAENFKVVLLLGARQTGKSTLLKNLLPEIPMIVFDPVQDLYEARKDPERFLELFASPLILDEVQFVPELLAALKRKVDKQENYGLYFLTGSQNFNVLKAITESMAGRVAIHHLELLTPLEIVGKGEEKGWLDAYLSSPNKFLKSKHSNIEGLPPLSELLFRGTFPRALSLPLSQLETFFLSYIQTYVERDVRLLENIQDLTTFGDFLRLVAVSSAQEINASHLGREIGLSSPTARKWLNLLLNTYQWIEVSPYHGNETKRISEKRKGYIKDTGLACHLLRIRSPEALVTSMKLGALFETWVVNYIHTQLMYTSKANCYHWRSHGGAEVDLILERDGMFYPIEIKCKSRPTKSDGSTIRNFRETYPQLKVMPGLIIHAGDESYPIDHDTLALSWKAR